MKLSHFFLLLPIAAILCSCEVFYPSVKNVDSYQLRAAYAQGPCFGRCPVYRLSLYGNGLLVYEGERFTDKEGTWTKLLGRAEVGALLDSFSRSNYDRWPSAYPSRLPDLSTRSVTYVSLPTGRAYTTSFREEAPANVVRLADRMSSLANSGGFRQESDTISRRENLIGQPIRRAAEELLVHLDPGVNPQAWIVNYANVNVTIKEKVSPNGSYYLLNSDPTMIPTDELLDRLRRDVAVISAQRNGRVSPR